MKYLSLILTHRSPHASVVRRRCSLCAFHFPLTTLRRVAGTIKGATVGSDLWSASGSGGARRARQQRIRHSTSYACGSTTILAPLKVDGAMQQTGGDHAGLHSMARGWGNLHLPGPSLLAGLGRARLPVHYCSGEFRARLLVTATLLHRGPHGLWRVDGVVQQ